MRTTALSGNVDRHGAGVAGVWEAEDLVLVVEDQLVLQQTGDLGEALEPLRGKFLGKFGGKGTATGSFRSGRRSER